MTLRNRSVQSTPIGTNDPNRVRFRRSLMTSPSARVASTTLRRIPLTRSRRAISRNSLN